MPSADKKPNDLNTPAVPETIRNVPPVPAPPPPPPASSGAEDLPDELLALLGPPQPPVPADAAGVQRLPGGEGYQLIERIGKGQYGEVHRALAPGGVVVAVKRIFRPMDDDASQRELKAMERVRELRHPFLLQTHNYYALEDRLIIVMELADGSLQDRYQECAASGLPGIPVEELLHYFSEAAEALDFLHSQKLAHRDIKPQNLLHLKGHAKVADFGVSRQQKEALDHTLDVGGTPVYMAPEVWNGDISIHSDQYSFALTWYEMRTGRRAFPGKKLLWEIARLHLSEEPDLSGVPEEERQVLLRALHKDPNSRFPSCGKFVEALKEATTPKPPPPPLPPPVSGRGVKIAVASLALAVAAVLVAVYAVLWHSQPSPPAPPPEAPRTAALWKPEGWEPEDPSKLVEDRTKHRFYRRLARSLDGQKVVLVVVPRTAPGDPNTFYIMENKVWNDLYAVFWADPQSKALFDKYSTGGGREGLVSHKPIWKRGGFTAKGDAGVEGPFRRAPVFRVTVTEAHCFAEWLGGRLPSKKQWLKAAGAGEDSRPGPFDGDPKDKTDLAIGPLQNGPWRVEKGQRDVSKYGCRQMASNGYEWTRDLDEMGEIPLETMNSVRPVSLVGQTYLSSTPLLFQTLTNTPSTKACTSPSSEVTFRVVLEE